MLESWFANTLGGFDATLLIILKVTLVLLLARLALVAMHRASASIRHLTIALALGSSLLLPLLSWVLPAWDVVPRPASIGIETTEAGTPVRWQPATETNRRLPASSPVMSQASAPSRGPEGWAEWLVLGWSGIAGALLMLLLGRVLANHRAVRRAEPIVDEDWLGLLAATRRQLGVWTQVELRRRSNRAMPLVWGLFHPTVLLPNDCDSWSPGRRRAVLAHELGHVVQRDIYLALISHLACAVHWFNPLVWWLQRRLTLERELACDQLVVDHGVPSAIYADHLLETAMAYRGGASLSPVMAARSQLEGRIMALLENTSRPQLTRTHKWWMAALVPLVLLPVASLAFAAPGPGWPPSPVDDEQALEAEAHRLQEGLEELQARLSKIDGRALDVEDRRLVVEQIQELKARRAEVDERFRAAEARRLELDHFHQMKAQSAQVEAHARHEEARLLELEYFEKLKVQSSEFEGRAREAEARRQVLQQLQDLEARSAAIEKQARQAEARHLESELRALKARASKVDDRALATEAERLEEQLRNLEARVSEIGERVRSAEAERRLERELRELEAHRR